MARCPYFGKCNGCSQQHVSYEMQLENKRKALENVSGSEVKVFSGKEFFYRNRMDFVFHAHGIGLREKGHPERIVDIEQCVIADERINKLLTEARAEFKEVDIRTFKFLVIRVSGFKSSISFALDAGSTRLKDAVERIKDHALRCSADNVVVTKVSGNESTSEDYFAVKGSDMLEEEYLGRKFMFNVQGFFQNNTEMAEKMHKYVNDLLSLYDTKDVMLLDLYSGVGTFGILNAGIFSKVVMVESFPGCVEAMKKNAVINDIKNSEQFLLDAKQIKKVDVNGKLFVITDPPRSGMDVKIIDWLNASKPEVIVYVSCNMQQLAKDVKKLKSYSVKSSALFDFFPQTWHCESVLVLERKGQ